MRVDGEGRGTALFRRHVRPWRLPDAVPRVSVVLRRPPGPSPEIEVVETSEEVVVAAVLDGVSPSDVCVAVAPHRVHLSAAGRPAPDLPSWDFRAAGFRREIAIAPRVIAERARATCRNGILEVTVPKRERGGRGVHRFPPEA